MGDMLIFSEVPNTLEVIGVVVILILNVVVVFSKWESPSDEEKKPKFEISESSPKISYEV